MKKVYFYDDEVKIVKGIEKFIIYGIENKGDIDISERKVKTITQKLGRKLAGGYFVGESKPYDFKENYTLITIPYSTRTRPYDRKDKFIINLIEEEGGF